MWGIVDMRVIVVMILQELETAQTEPSPGAPDPARSDRGGNVFVAPDRFELSTSRL